MWTTNDSGGTWTQVTLAAGGQKWAPRSFMASLVTYGTNKLLVSGGRSPATLLDYADVWTSSGGGNTWTAVCASPPWQVFCTVCGIVPCLCSLTSCDAPCVRSVFGLPIPSQARSQHQVIQSVFGLPIFLVGGMNRNNGQDVLMNDVWVADEGDDGTALN